MGIFDFLKSSNQGGDRELSAIKRIVSDYHKDPAGFGKALRARGFVFKEEVIPGTGSLLFVKKDISVIVSATTTSLFSIHYRKESEGHTYVLVNEGVLNL